MLVMELAFGISASFLFFLVRSRRGWDELDSLFFPFAMNWRGPGLELHPVIATTLRNRPQKKLGT